MLHLVTHILIRYTEISYHPFFKANKASSKLLMTHGHSTIVNQLPQLRFAIILMALGG